jgi:hypothetical protein
MKQDLKLLNFLKNEKFDVAITNFFIIETLLTQAAGIPTIRVSAFVPSIFMHIFNG